MHAIQHRRRASAPGIGRRALRRASGAAPCAGLAALRHLVAPGDVRHEEGHVGTRFEVEWAGIERVLSSAGLPTPLEMRIDEPDLWRTSPQATVWRKR